MEKFNKDVSQIYTKAIKIMDKVSSKYINPFKIKFGWGIINLERPSLYFHSKIAIFMDQIICQKKSGTLYCRVPVPKKQCPQRASKSGKSSSVHQINVGIGCFHSQSSPVAVTTPTLATVLSALGTINIGPQLLPLNTSTRKI